VEAFSELNLLEIESCVRLKLTRTAERSYFDDRKKGSSKRSQSGTMCEPSTVSRGVERWMSLLEDSLAKTSALQEKEKDSQENEVDYGEKWGESLAKYDHFLHSWKTRQLLLFEDSTSSLEILPKWGMTQNGELYQRQALAHIINVRGVSYLPTPQSIESGFYRTSVEKRGNHQIMLCNIVLSETGKYINPAYSEAVMMWTIGWTDLKPLGMDKYRQWFEQHGSCSQSEEKEQKDDNKREAVIENLRLFD